MTNTMQAQRDGMKGEPADGATEESVPGDRPGEITPPPSWIVWFMRLFSLAILLALIGYLLYLALRPTVPAQFDIGLDFGGAERREGQWVLPVELTNSSTEAVSEIVLEVLQGEVTRTVTIALLGEGEMAEVEFRFPREPSESNTDAAILSYQSP